MQGLRRRSARRLGAVRVPYPFDIDLLCAEVAAARGRPLHRLPLPGLSPGSPCGLWLGLPHADYVFFDPATSPLHAEHIVLHEIAHILCGHTTGDAAAQLFPDLDPAMVARALARAGHTTGQEREAEMLASVIRADQDPDRDGRVRTVLRAYRTLLALRPLWSAMRQAFPEMVLWRPARSAVELRGVAGVRLRLYRRVIEIRDGMLALRDHLPARTVIGDADPAAAEARAITVALRRRGAGQPAASPPRQWAPVGPEMADEVAWLCAVSAAYRRISAEGARTPTPAGPGR
jgi:hypothetical protein